MTRHKLFCLVGPSGTGKDTIKREVGLPYVVSYRTRKPRVFEVPGVDGHFITEEEFLDRKERQEWIAETHYKGNYYGIGMKELSLLESSPMLYVIDWAGVETIKESFRDLDGFDERQVVTIFIRSSKEDILDRMQKERTVEEIEQRMEQYEIDKLAEEKCDFLVLNKGSVETAADMVRSIINFMEE